MLNLTFTKSSLVRYRVPVRNGDLICSEKEPGLAPKMYNNTEEAAVCDDICLNREV